MAADLFETYVITIIATILILKILLKVKSLVIQTKTTTVTPIKVVTVTVNHVNLSSKLIQHWLNVLKKIWKHI